MTQTTSRLLLAAACAASFWASGCSDAHANADSHPSSAPAAPSTAVADAPIEAYRTELLELGFKTASAFPLHPHVKNRSRAQESVVTACLALDQPKRALGYVEQIADWRRGTGYADCAFYYAQHGKTADIEHYLDLARQVSERSAAEEGDDTQGWRKDRIRAGIAKTYLWLGQEEKAAEFETGGLAVETAKVGVVKARKIDADSFEEQMHLIDTTTAVGNFEEVQNVLEMGAQLFDRFYADAERRNAVEEKIKTSWKKQPAPLRIRLLSELAGFAVAHQDNAKALALVDESRAMLDESKWLPEDRIPFLASLAALRFEAGDEIKARGEIDSALASFEAECEQIVDIYRADSLRPIAEAYQAMGDTTKALSIYSKVVEEGVSNPNSRPRADDLTATCCSMAVHGAEPDAKLRARMTQICAGLGNPW